MTTTDPDRMALLGTLPDPDFGDMEVRRDYDTVLLPGVQLGLAGIREARKLLDDAEREILRYRFRAFDAEDDWTGRDIDIARCRHLLESLGPGTGFDELGPYDLGAIDWLEVSRRLERLNGTYGYVELRELRDLHALLAGDEIPEAAS